MFYVKKYAELSDKVAAERYDVAALDAAVATGVLRHKDESYWRQINVPVIGCGSVVPKDYREDKKYRFKITATEDQLVKEYVALIRERGVEFMGQATNGGVDLRIRREDESSFADWEMGGPIKSPDKKLAWIVANAQDWCLKAMQNGTFNRTSAVAEFDRIHADTAK